MQLIARIVVVITLGGLISGDSPVTARTLQPRTLTITRPQHRINLRRVLSRYSPNGSYC